MSTTLANITQLADDRRRSSSTAIIDWTGNGFRGVNGALQIWNQIHDWPWQVESVNFNYNEGITYYPISSTLNFKAILNVSPFRTAELSNTLYYVTNNYFDVDFIHTWKLAVQTTAQSQILRVKYTGNTISVAPATSVIGNGTWIGAGGISSVSANSYDSFDLSASLVFNYTGTSGTLTDTMTSAIDLSLYAQRSVFYFNYFFQSVTNFTSFTLKIGSSSSNYITGTITTDYLGNALVVGWNKCKLVWDGSTTTVGTPVTTAIAYVQLTVTYGSSSTTVGNRLENLFVSENVPMILQYYSNNMVTTSAGSKSEIFANSASTTDTALWSGNWDYVNEAYINSLMEIVAWLNGDVDDRTIAVQRISAFVEPLKSKLPSRRRYAEVSMATDINGSPQRRGNPLKFNRAWW